MPLGTLVVAGMVIILAAVFWIVRRITSRWLQDDWSARKILLYVLAFGGTFALVGANEHLNDAVLTASFLTLIAAFFAVLTAPDKSN